MKSREFKLDSEKTATQYFKYIDKDEDGLVSFHDFLGPLLATIPPHVAMVFVTDMRQKMDSYQRIRTAFAHCGRLSPLVTPDLVKARLSEPNDDLCQFHVKALEEMQLPGDALTQAEWLKVVASEEKHTVDSFTTLLYQQQNPDWVDPKQEISAQITQALSKDDLTLQEAKDLLALTAGSLQPKPLTDLYVPPANRNTWKRFRSCASSFFDIVTDEMTTLDTKDELLMLISELKAEKEELSTELDEMRDF